MSTASGGGTVVHSRTGNELAVSSEHAKILELAGESGLDPMDPLYTDVVERYRELGLLVPASFATVAPVTVPPVTAPGPNAPVPEQPVPCLRPTLKVSPKGGSSLVNVSEPSTGKSFQLYDFEVTLARMLDGRRTHAQVVEAARNLGLPVTFESLVRFLRELERYGFLAPAGTVGAEKPEPSIWPARETWDEATRALFQSGLRMHRQGRYHESAAYFEAMLAQNPNNPEAKEMLEQAKERAAQPPPPGVTTLPEVTNRPIEQFDELSLDDAPRPAGAADLDVPTATPGPVIELQPDELEAAVRRRGRRLLLAAVGLAALGVAGVGWVGWKVVRPLTAAPGVVAPPVEPAPAVVAVVDAGPARAEAAAVMPDIDVALAAEPDAGAAAEPDAGAAAVVAAPMVVAAAPVVDAGAPVAAAVPAVVATPAVVAVPAVVATPAVVAAPAAVVPAVVAAPVDAGAKPAVAAAPDPTRDWQVFAINKRGRVKMGEVVAPSGGVLSWKVTDEQRVKKAEQVGVVQTAGGEKRLTAPVQGLVIQTVAEGQPAKAGQVVADILYHEAYLQTVVTGKRPTPAWACEVFDEASAQQAECTVGAVTPRGAGFFLTAILLPRWFDAAAAPKLRLAPP